MILSSEGLRKKQRGGLGEGGEGRKERWRVVGDREGGEMERGVG